MLGLTTAQAQEQMRLGNSNISVDNTAKTTKQIVRENLLTYFNLIFLVLAILVIIAGSFKSLTFLPVVIANTLIGIVQQVRAKKVLDELAVLNQPTASVFRDGELRTLPTTSLVKGDVIHLKEGRQIPADAVVLEGEVAVNEALLTGEADEIEKHPDSGLMSGSFVVNGECTALLTAVGYDSYINQLSLKAKQMKAGEQSEMVRSINRFVLMAGIAIIPVGIALFVQGMRTGYGFSESVVRMVAAVIGMIPEGLYLLVSITLVLSAVRLARNKVMLHDMKSTETLARVDTLCVDKTGTITENRMEVVDVVLPVRAGDVSPPAEISGQTTRIMTSYLSALPDDNATMQALRVRFASQGHKTPLDKMPFSSRRKYSAVSFEEGTFVLGAPDILLKDTYDQYREQIDSYATQGLRVLTLAEVSRGGRSVPASELKTLDGVTVTPLLFVLLQNPLRAGASETFSYFDQQGVEVRVISGDNPVTVSEVALRAGIKGAEHYVDASVLAQMDPPEQQKTIAETIVFGRVTPEMKQTIIKTLKSQGRTVAMTGDGVNDILAMKDADCSIAMAAGSDAAVQAAQVVLLDSDFSRMPAIVAEGRRDINNVERSATLFLVKNIFSLLLSVFTIVSVRVYPLQPTQISLISLFNIGAPAFLLALEGNPKRIAGHFMTRVLTKAMPAAITDFIAIAALVVFGEVFLVPADEISVASTYLLAIVGFMILVKISQPMNRYRAAVLVICVVGIISFSFLLSDLYAISMVSYRCGLLFVVFAIATEPMMRYLGRLFALIGDRLTGDYVKRERPERARPKRVVRNGMYAGRIEER
ncbi:MAG: HAD-IC family P-type ATPase [Lachnospiraceae bacterium]|nr:HAD-IC family P-type ATPase [Lachnospiraceae bacterium]